MALQEITLQNCLLRRGDLITDTQLNSIFNEILKGPTERIMMLLILIRVVTGKWHFHKENGHGHLVVRNRMLFWVSQEGQTHSMTIVTQLVCCVHGVSWKARTAAAADALTEDSESIQIVANALTQFGGLQQTKTARG